MPASSLVSRFKEMTGRYDLSDSDVYFFLDKGQRILDRKVNAPVGFAWHKEDVSSGAGFLTFRNCRAVKEVWVYDADGRSQLERKSLGWIMEQTDVDNGRPAYYAPAVIRLEPSQYSLTSSNYTNEFTYGSDGILFSDQAAEGVAVYNGVVWLPKTDGAYTVEVLGLFMSNPIVDGTEKTFWTEEEPHLLVLAAAYVLETFYRNEAGASAIMSQLNEMIMLIDKDNVEQEIAGITQMEEEIK